MAATRFIIIRHGETEWNAEGREMGQLDSPLTAKGRAQAGQLAARLARTRLDAVYSSDLGRAVATAGIIAERHGVAVIYDARLRERHGGIFQGLTIAEMRERFPKERVEYERREYDHVIPGGESARQRVERTMACLNELAARHPDGGTVLVVTHGGILMGLFQHVIGVAPEKERRFRLGNAAVNVFTCDGGRWMLETWGDVAHLEVRAADDL